MPQCFLAFASIVYVATLECYFSSSPFFVRAYSRQVGALLSSTHTVEKKQGRKYKFMIL